MSIFYSLSLLGQFWQEKINNTFVKWIVFFILAQIVILFFTFSSLPSQIPFYYSLPWGEIRLAPVANLFLFPLLSVFIFIVNSMLSMYYSPKIKLLSQLLISIAFIFNLFALIGLIHIIFLVL